MKIVANMINLRVAGGRSVAMNFMRAFQEGGFPHELIAYVPQDDGFEALSGGSVTARPVPDKYAKPSWRIWVDNMWWTRTLREDNPDVVFNLSSIALPITLPQLVLFHWPYAIYPEPAVWQGMDLRSRLNRNLRYTLFRRRIQYATRIAAQTDTAKTRLEKLYDIEDVRVVPNAVSLPARSEKPVDLAYTLPDEKRRLLCLCRYYPHKNLEVLVDLARLIRDNGAPYVVLTTISESDHPAVEGLLATIEAEGLSDILINLGTVPMEQLPALYQACDGLLLPTLLESFSGTYVEAMDYGVPVFTSDRDFARDVCADEAYYFDPRSPAAILGTVESAFADPDELTARLARARVRAHSFPDWPDVAKAYVGLLEELAD